ncbi:MAG: hypothetical protein AAGG59_07705 [Bacteroidota bacterium]
MNKTRLLLLLVLTSSAALGQSIKRVFNENEDQYLGVSASTQFWARYAQLNPGSTIDGKRKDEVVDLSIRRYRINLYGSLDSKTKFNLSIGNNNVGSSLESQPKLLDAYLHYQWKSWLGFGGGKSSWVGLSRYTAPSTSGALGTDIQFGALPLLNRSDDLLRKMSVFANGQVGIFDYRVVLAKPTAPEDNVPNEAINFTSIAPDYQISTYLKFQFKDKEKQTSAYARGSYHGKKEIFNIGFGSLYQPSTTVIATATDTNYYAAKSVAVDLFYESKIYKGYVVTGYVSYHHHNLGPNFIRQVGANNAADGITASTALNGKGVSRFVSGSGDNLHIDAAILKPLKASQKAIQFYTSIDFLKLNALDGNVVNLESGINFLFNGHRSKLNLGYQNWPVVNKETRRSEERKSAIVIQYQLKIG